MNLRVLLAVAWIFTVGAAVSWGQPTPEQAHPGPPATFGLAPEDSYLSPTRYTSAYFGFSFDFPEEFALRPVPQPASLDRRIQMLELIGSVGNRAGVSISAYEYKNKNYTDAKSRLRRQLEQEIFSGVEQVRGLSKINIGDRLFYYYQIRKGAEQHAALAAEMSGYVVEVELHARSEDVLRQLFAAFSRAEFFPPRDAERRAGPRAAVYRGPAVSEDHMRAVRESRPVDQIPPGKINGRSYSNSQIGVTYEFPPGWYVEPEGAIEPAIEQYRESVSGEPSLGPRERAVVKACRKTLLSVWRTKPAPNGEVPYEEFGEVTLSAMPLSCFPNIRFPGDAKDAAAVREFVVGLRFTQPLQRDMTDARTYEQGGRPFVLTHGTIAYRERGDSLSRRISVALAMTQQRGYLLIWLFAAPHEAELRELMESKVELAPSDGSASAPTPGGGSASQKGPPKPDITLQGDWPSAAASSPNVPRADSAGPTSAPALRSQSATSEQPPAHTEPTLEPPK